MPAKDAKSRFSDRVENYINYRPSYPTAVYNYLQQHTHLTAASRIVDVGSGSGILAKLLLDHGHTVIGIEPNQAMRAASQRLLASCERFTAVDGSAEATTLPSQSADLITAGQAFHWFEPHATRTEFQRILRPGGQVALVWNEQRLQEDPPMQAYESLLLHHADSYNKVRQTNSYADIEAFFGQPITPFTCPNVQLFDFPGLRGRFLSSSYSPPPGHPQHEAALAALRQLFERYAENGRFAFTYSTRLFLGRLAA